MGRRTDRWAPPPRGGKPPTEPVEPIDLYPNTLTEPRPPETRETVLADLHAALAALNDEELKVAQLWIYGRSVADVCHFLKMDETRVRGLWKTMRRKLREALIAGAARTPPAPPQPQIPHATGETAAG